MYSLINTDEKEVTESKEVKRIKHQEFVDVLFNKKLIRQNLKRIQSNLYKIGTYNIC